MILDSLTVDPEAFAAGTGWKSTPEGLCKGAQCVPAPEAITAAGQIDVSAAASKLNMAVVEDTQHGLFAIGPESGGRALTTATVPDLALTDSDGNPFLLTSLHGRKVLLVAWASW